MDGVLVTADELDDLGRDHAGHAGGRRLTLFTVLEKKQSVYLWLQVCLKLDTNVHCIWLTLQKKS